MRVHEFAKELSKETGKTITSNDLLMILSKKKEGIKPQSSIDEELMRFVRSKYMEEPPKEGKAKKPAVKQKEIKTDEVKKPAARTPEVRKRPSAKPEHAGEAKRPASKPEHTGEVKRPSAKPEHTGEAKRPAAKPEHTGEAKRPAAKPEHTGEAKRPAVKPEHTGEAKRPSSRPEHTGEAKRPAVKPEHTGEAKRPQGAVRPNGQKPQGQLKQNPQPNRKLQPAAGKNGTPAGNRKNNQQKPAPATKPQPKQPEEPTIKSIILPESLSVKELADKLKVPVNAMIKKLFLEGKMVTVNTELSFDDAAEIALEYNFIADEEEKVDMIEEILKDVEDPEETLSKRPPVVCVMGHVDHGKTSLLDAIRKTSVTEEEAGGITQHIGAYVVKVNDERITFLDTPGHEAFTAMRMRGARSTDIAILVVAADDGVMPQTIEAINHAKAAGIEIIVAINKIDKESANVDRVKQELIEYGLVPEDWGGSTIFCPVSAHTKEGLDNLLEMILLTSEILELKANKNRKARGVVIEARLDKGRGPVATVLVQKGTLKVGDCIAIGNVNGRVRAMLDHKQRRVKEALPSTPVEILGLNGVPNSGEIFIATNTEKEARQISEAFITRGKENLIAETKSKMSLDDLFNKMQEGSMKELNLIIKADVQGSVEAVKQSLLKLSNDEIVIKCIHAGVGAINESDVILASASDAIIIGFNIRPDAQAKELADREKVDVRLYRVIYNAIEDIESAMKGMLDPIYEEKVIGHAEVRQIYKASGVGTIAGSYVLDGMVQRNCSVRISREGEQIFEGKLASLKRFKDDVKEVKAGFECGLVFENFNDIKEEDQIEAYTMVEVPR